MASPRRVLSKRELLDEVSNCERSYTKSLQALCGAYVDPLKATKLFSDQEVTSVFRNLPMLCKVHERLSSCIAAAVDGQGGVSSSLVSVADELNKAHAALQDCYALYARTHGEALHCLRGIQARPEVARQLAFIAAQDHTVEGEALESLLNLPLVHAEAMAGLLGSLLGMLAASDPGYASLLGAVNLWTEVGRVAAEGGFGSAPPPSTPAQAAATGSSSSSSSSAATSGMHPSIAQMLDGRNVQVLTDMAGHSSSSNGGAGATAASAATQAAYRNALPLPILPSTTLASQLARADISTDSVVTAQIEADEAARRLDELEREVELKERELRLAKEEVARVEAAASSSGANAATLTSAGAIEESLRTLQEEERELYARMVGSEHRGVYEAFLQRKKDLEEEELRLAATLAEHEETLSQIRQRLANPPASVLPTDQAKQALYLAWKRALAEREEYLRQARRRKHDLLKDLKIRFETQVVLLEMERRNAVDGLKSAVGAEKAKVEASRRELASLDEQIEGARAAMKKFRTEFESLRVGLLIDRMAKSGQVASLAERRAKLQREAEQFSAAVEAARQRVAAEESAKWEARLAAEREAGEKRVADEKKLIEQKIEQVRNALADRYEAGFRPLLRETEARHVEELQKVVALQRELEAKEAELRAAHESARGVSAAVNAAAEGDGVIRDPTTGEAVPEWKLREFEDLKSAVAGLWEQLDVPAEDVTAFLSEADLLAPYSPQVLEMYQDMYQRLSHNLPAVPPATTSSFAPDQTASSFTAPRYGSLEQVSPPHARTPAQPLSASLSSSKSLLGAPSMGGAGSRGGSRR